MPQGVSGLFGATAMISAPTSGPSWSGGSGDGGSSFDEALDRARTSDSADSSADAAKPSTKPAATKKTSSGDAAAKKKSATSQGEQAKADAKPAGESAGEAAPQSEPGPKLAKTSDERSGHAGEGKQQKKAEPSGDLTPANDPAAVMPLPNAPAEPHPADAASDPKSESAGSKMPAAKVPHEPQANSESSVSAQDAQGASTAPQNGDSAASKTAAEPQPAADPGPDALQPAKKSRLAIQAKPPDALPADSTGTSAAAVAAVQGLEESGDATSSSGAIPPPPDASALADAATPVQHAGPKSADDLVLQSLVQQHAAHPGGTTTATGNDAPNSTDVGVSPTAQFAETNHAKIVSGIQGRLLPGGGSMQIRLDPPELGALQVRVEMRDGVMTASFETSSDQATKLLSHSLGDLKTALEAQGVNVEKLHVSQSSRRQESSSGNGGKDESQPRQDTAAQQEQQRREMMQRMWRRLMKGQDPLDLVA